jgi:UDP-3-O-[3-hydroxymyristoyl] N-acetylglucosamine deacetylase
MDQESKVMQHFSPYQRTLEKAVTRKGIGVHSGASVTLTLEPLAIDQGIIFERSDKASNNRIHAGINAVCSTAFSTKIANEFNVDLSTIEHLMAALAAFQICNVLVRVSGPEMPIMDGSAWNFVEMIQQAQVIDQPAPAKIIRILKKVTYTEGTRSISFEPFKGLAFDFSIDFGGREGMAPQAYSFTFATDTFIDEISQARTYGFYADAEKLYAMNLAQGSSLANSVVIRDGEVINETGLRYHNEMVRHKILDALGDFYLAGHMIQGRCRGFNAGHEMNNQIMRKILADPTAYEIVTLDCQAQPHSIPEAQVLTFLRPALESHSATYKASFK